MSAVEFRLKSRHIISGLHCRITAVRACFFASEYGVAPVLQIDPLVIVDDRRKMRLKSGLLIKHHNSDQRYGIIKKKPGVNEMQAGMHVVTIEDLMP